MQKRQTSALASCGVKRLCSSKITRPTNSEATVEFTPTRVFLEFWTMTSRSVKVLANSKATSPRDPIALTIVRFYVISIIDRANVFDRVTWNVVNGLHSTSKARRHIRVRSDHLWDCLAMVRTNGTLCKSARALHCSSRFQVLLETVCIIDSTRVAKLTGSFGSCVWGYL
jgi:hypothetical protein